jgi:small subunit ribosomal protein S3
MGQKISPISLRTGINKDWASRWFGGRKYVNYLKDDLKIREFLEKHLKNTGIDKVDICRGADVLNVTIYTARPGLLIGRGGGGVEELKKLIQKLVKNRVSIKLEIQEFKNAELSAKIMAESMAEQTEKRIPYRRVLNQALSKIMSNKNAKGAKVQIAGRLNGSEIARTEHLDEGSLPLQTLRADIDFARATAVTTYGTVGIKVWIYKGEKF